MPPDLVTITEWIVNCWKTLDPQIIVKSFKHCCISKVLDDILWTDKAIRQEELEAQEDKQYDKDDILFNDEDIMSTEQLKQLFMESDKEDFLVLNFFLIILLCYI